MINKTAKYFHVVIYDIKHTSYDLLVNFYLYCVYKMVVANKLLKATTSFAGGVRRHHPYIYLTNNTTWAQISKKFVGGSFTELIRTREHIFKKVGKKLS